MLIQGIYAFNPSSHALSSDEQSRIRAGIAYECSVGQPPSLAHRHGKSVFHGEVLDHKPDPHHHLPGYRRARGMGDIVNLRRARKQAKRQLEEQRAAANRVRYGRSKAERVRAGALDEKARQSLDGHRIETGDDG